MAQNGYISMSVPVHTRDELEEIRRANGLRSRSEVVQKLTLHYKESGSPDLEESRTGSGDKSDRLRTSPLDLLANHRDPYTGPGAAIA